MIVDHLSTPAMFIRYFLLTVFAAILHTVSLAQTCTTPGQNPSTAFPVCGTSTFAQASVPICGGRVLPSPNCTRGLLRDVNPFWYKFTCFQSGTLGFEITPVNLRDDYDWEIYDVTGRNPDDIYTEGSLVISSNWSGDGGVTGASGKGTQALVCEGFGKPVFSSMPALQAGHNYLMLVSHFTQSQSGYSLSFKGGTGVITDTVTPKLKAAEANCRGDELNVSINKKMKCSSLTAAGSEFYITPFIANVISAVGINCSAQFDTDSIQLTLSQALVPGNYTLHIKKGSDGNTLLDYCDNSIDEMEKINFSVFPKLPPSFDSIAPVECAAQKLKIVLSTPILCSSIATNTSDFSITGTYPVSISGVTANCTSTKEIILTLAKPLQQAGTFTINLLQGSDGNTIIDECGEEVPAGGKITFSVKDTVNADFTYKISYGCTRDTVQYFHAAANGINSWQWNLDEGIRSNRQNAVALYKLFDAKTATLVVSNGFCTDSSTQSFTLDNYLKADFDVFEDNCPKEPITFTSTAVGKIVQHNWSFGDGGTASTASPSYVYAVPQRETSYSVLYTVTDSLGCQSKASKKVKIYTSCFLALPTAFTPNDDGLNDFLQPLNAIKAEQLVYKVYNRWGQLLYKTGDWKQGWNGKVNGIPQASGTYVWTLQYINRDTKKLVQEKGTAVLIR
jgi:gliding motility-associated-like protein